MYNHKSQNELLNLFIRHSAPSVFVVDNALVDFFGCIIPVDCIPHLINRKGSIVSHPPLPDDSFRATAIEYQSILESIDDCKTSEYVFLELGASYAPFCGLAAKIALRNKNINKVYIRAVEAAKNANDAIESYWCANNLINNSRVDHLVINSALGSSFGTAKFPDLDCTVDNGGGISSDGVNDIRGVSLKLMDVNLIPFDSVLESLGKSDLIVDLAHFDLQGSEGDVLVSAIGLLNTRCKRVLVGTHSRYLEGYLFELFLKNGWSLLGEEPCEFVPCEGRSVCGMTVKDGNLYLINKRYL